MLWPIAIARSRIWKWIVTCVTPRVLKWFAHPRVKGKPLWPKGSPLNIYSSTGNPPKTLRQFFKKTMFWDVWGTSTCLLLSATKKEDVKLDYTASPENMPPSWDIFFHLWPMWPMHISFESSIINQWPQLMNDWKTVKIKNELPKQWKQSP